MMKQAFLPISLILLLVLIAFGRSLTSFFVQDDFILISYFSQNTFYENVSNIFRYPSVTHWRPLHNLFFFLTGTFFEKNPLGYHLVLLALLSASGFLVYKITLFVTKERFLSVFSSFIYVTQPAHFVALYWISGGATLIGSFFILAGFYSLLKGKRRFSLLFYLLALFASEAMIVGSGIFFGWILTKRRFLQNFHFLFSLFLITLLFILIKLFFLGVSYPAYEIDFSLKILSALKYYLFRVIGFAEVSGDLIPSLLLVSVYFLLGIFFIIKKVYNKELGTKLFFLFAIFLGLFPFVLMPNHLSPHYMNISIWGFATLAAIFIKSLDKKIILTVVLIILVIFIWEIKLTEENNWVINRSALAKAYINNISNENPKQGSVLVFRDNVLSTSEEAYVVLGQGKALDFWFKDKKYKSCFTFFEECDYF